MTTCSAKVTEVMTTRSTKVTEVEGNIQGVSNLFDNLKLECKFFYKDQITKISKICEKTKQNDNKKVSTKRELVKSNISKKPCRCEEDTESLKGTVTVLDLQCRSMKNSLIFTGLHEVNDECTEDLLRDFLYSELGMQN